jgi:hypothetical protein
MTVHWRTSTLGVLLFGLGLGLACPASAQTPDAAQLLERLQRLEKNQAEMQKQLDEKDKRIDALEEELKRSKQAETPKPGAPATVEAPAPAPPPPPVVQAPTPPSAVGDLPPPEGGDATPYPPQPVESASAKKLGSYRPPRGFFLTGNDQWGEINFGIYTYVRFLEQKGLEDDATNGPSKGSPIDKREDLQLAKVKLEFRGWFLDPRFQYTLYTWTNQNAQGQGAQVVVGGNLNWVLDPALKIGAGILSLPSTRSTQGTFPYWLTVDHRTLADEFFRASYSQGIFAYGTKNGFGYYGMLANNLSTLGIDAGQLDGDFTTFSGALWWMPTTGEYGPRAGFGDYEEHRDLATLIGVHFTFSPEDKQSQPDSDGFDNTQIRLSDGTVIFQPGALAPNVTVENVKYYMWTLDTGLKYRGLALDSEYFMRFLNDFRTAGGPVPERTLFDHGFQVLASAMVMPRTVQVYTTGSYIFGEFGDSWETIAGLNWFFFRRREVRLNFEYMYDHHSPTGGISYPQTVGGTGSIGLVNLEMNF